MGEECHRCGSAVGGDDAFCATCGAPQLRFAREDEVATSRAAEGAGLDADGLASPGAAAGALRGPEARTVDWRRAFRSALMLAVPIGVLTALPGLSFGFVLWVVGGAIMAVARYRRKRPGTLLDLRSGFRIGALTGLLAAYTSVALAAALQVFQRFSMHLGPAIDRVYTDRMEQSTAMMQSSAQSAAQLRAYLAYVLTPDGRAGMALAASFTTIVMMVLLAGLGGIVGVRVLRHARTG